MFLLLCAASSAHAGPPTSEMHERYQILSTARDHVIQGDLDKAQASATDMTEMKTRRIPRRWRSYASSVDDAILQLQVAASLDDAAAAVGKAGAACGACHAAEEARPWVSDPSARPSPQWSEGQQMSLHRWAMDWMWVGLVSDDDEAWSRGASELDNRPLLFRFSSIDDASAGRTELEQQVHDLAKYATLSEADMRGEVFGMLVSTCSQCHVARNQEAAAPAEAAPSDSTGEPEAAEEGATTEE